MKKSNSKSALDKALHQMSSTEYFNQLNDEKKINNEESLKELLKEFIGATCSDSPIKKEDIKGENTSASAYVVPGYHHIPPFVVGDFPHNPYKVPTIDWTVTTPSKYLAITLNTGTGEWSIPCSLGREDMECLVEQLFEKFGVESVVKSNEEVPTEEEIEQEFIIDCLKLADDRENCGLDVVYMIADEYDGTECITYVGALSEIVYDYINEKIGIEEAVTYILDAKELLPYAEN